MTEKYCAIIRVCSQVSPDDWEMVTTVLEVTPETTVKQITDWYKNHRPRDTRIDVSITNLEQVNP
jgi:hypothetical protein